MRKLALLAPLVACSLFAVTPRYWVVSSPDDFLAGEAEGIAISAQGRLSVAPAVHKVGTFTDPFVLSQTTDDSGRRYFGTGNSGRVYRLVGNELKVFYTAPEPEIYAMAWSNGALYVGTSPNGKVYRLDDAGKASVFFDPKQAFIWALQAMPDGSLAVGTGVEGKLFRVDRSGAGKLLFTAPESHIRSLAIGAEGRILAGGSGEGRIYEVSADGHGRGIFDSPLTEISSIVWDPKTSTGWAAGVANVLPSSAPAKSSDQTKTTATASTDAKKDSTTASADAQPSVEVSVSFDDQTSSAGSGATPGAELYRITADGYVETMRKFDREVIYSLALGNNGALLIGTGPGGRIYELRNRDISLIATVPDKQVVTLQQVAGGFDVTTTNAGAIYHLDNAAPEKPEFRSAVKDAERFSRFGHYELKGQALDKSRFLMAFRSGNTNTPDDTWSEWHEVTGASGEAGVPPARYIQWRLRMQNPSPETAVDSVTLAYMNRNVAPVVDSVSVLEPAAVMVSSSYPSSPQVLEATNPDEYGIFTSLDSPKASASDPGKKLYRKGYRTITWKARDENGDSLRYSVAFRARNGGEWLRLRDNVEESSINFDTSQLPDGMYEVRVTASDANDNPTDPQTFSKEGTEFLVDNTPPRISTESAGDALRVRVHDDLSAVGRVEYSVNATKWERLIPEDGIADSRDETYRIPRAAGFVVIRAVDSYYNVATSNGAAAQ